MAVSTAYGLDGYSLTAGAATVSGIRLKGGRYGILATATFGGGSVNLQILAPDGTTYVTVGTSTNFSAAGYVAVDLPPGLYQIAITTATAVQVSIGLIRSPNVV